MKAISGVLAALVVGQVFLTGLAAESTKPVEPVDFWGEPSLVTIRGCRTYPADDIHRALFRHPDVRLAAHRGAPLEKYLDALRIAVENGYRTSGFREPKIVIARDLSAGRITIAIQEGERYKAGAVRIEGAKLLSPEQLVTALTKPRFAPGATNNAVAENPDGQDGEDSGWIDRDGNPVRPQSALWPVDAHAPLDDQSQAEIKKVIREAYAAAGRHAPQFEISTVARPDRHVVDLAVKITDEGPASIVEEIEIKGLKQNSPADVLKFLDVKPGMLLTRQEITRIERALWRSGRFSEYRVAAQPPQTPKPVGKFKLRIELREYAKAAPVSQPLTAEETALLRLRQWLISPARQNVDFLIQSSQEESPGEIIMAPGRGVLAWMGWPGSGAISGLQYAAVFSDRLNSLYAAERSEKLELAPSDWRVKIPGKIDLSTKGGKPYYFKFGCGVSSVRKDLPQGACEFSLVAPPAFALAQAHEYLGTTECKVVDGVLHLRTENYSLSANSETGELIDGQFESPCRFQVFVVHGVFDERLAELQKITSNYRQALKPTRPLTSMLRFFCDESFVRLITNDQGSSANPGTSLRALPIMAHFLDCGVLAPLEEALGDDSWPEFPIPQGDVDWAFDQPKMRNLLPRLNALFPTLSDNLFAADSWAERLWREFVLAGAGRDTYLGEELEAWLKANEYGPLECAMLWTLLPNRKTGAGPGGVAALGLNKMSTADFRHDCQALLDPASVTGRTLLQAAYAIRTLDQADVDYLFGLNPSLRETLAPLFQSLREEPPQPLSEALRSGLERSWKAGLSTQVAALLKVLASAPTSADAKTPEPRTATSPLPEAKHPAAIGGIAETPLGLEGFCPVTLREERRWVPGDSAMAVVVQGRAYWLADSTAKQKFEQDSSRYVPKFSGDDLVAWFDQGKRIPGDRRHGVFFDQRIYLFENEQNLAAFSANPTRYMNPPLNVPDAAVPEGLGLGLRPGGLPLFSK